MVSKLNKTFFFHVVYFAEFTHVFADSRRFMEISGWKGTEKIEIRDKKMVKSIILRIFWLKHRDKQADRNYCIVIQYGLTG